jgi:hypothetical protein
MQASGTWHHLGTVGTKEAISLSVVAGVVAVESAASAASAAAVAAAVVVNQPQLKSGYCGA